MISVLILTRNEEQDLPGCLASVAWSDDVWVLDSLSTDGTRAVAEAAGARVVERAFDNWAAHQNWALDQIEFRYPWCSTWTRMSGCRRSWQQVCAER